MGFTLLIASGKGGVGKTTFTVNLGYVLAAAGARVLVLDLNMGLRNDDIYLGMEDCSIFDLGDVVSGVCSLEKAIVHHYDNENLALLSCPQYKDINGLSADHLKLLCDSLKKEYDVILMDTPTGINESFCAAAACADKSLVIITPDYVSVRNGDAVDRKLESLGVMDRFYALNRVKKSDMEGQLPQADFILKFFQIPLAGVMAEDEEINLANNRGIPCTAGSDNYITKSFAQIAARLIK